SKAVSAGIIYPSRGSRLGGSQFRFRLKQVRLDRIEPQNFSYSRKASPVNRQRPKFLQDAAVLGGWIAFVGCQTIAGIDVIELDHVRVTRRLGDDRGRRNTGRKSVTVHNASLWRRAVRYAASVDQHEVRDATEAAERALHG